MHGSHQPVRHEFDGQSIQLRASALDRAATPTSNQGQADREPAKPSKKFYGNPPRLTPKQKSAGRDISGRRSVPMAFAGPKLSVVPVRADRRQLRAGQIVRNVVLSDDGVH